MNDIEKTNLYKQYERFLKSRAYKAAGKYMVTYAVDDLFQEASVAWCKAINAYDAKKGTRLNYVWRVVDNSLANAAAAMTRVPIAPDGWGVAEDMYEIPAIEEAYEITDAKICMDNDERVMIDEALTHEHKSMASIIRRMQAFGWSRRKAQKVFYSIKQKFAA